MTIFGISLSPTGAAIVSTLFIMAEAVVLYVVYGALMRGLSARLRQAQRSDAQQE